MFLAKAFVRVEWKNLVDEGVEELVESPITLAAHELPFEDVVPGLNQHISVDLLENVSVFSVYSGPFLNAY